ncbi:hypothetical protein VOLCADRAFT_90347 [Volvox carteri f. nagariensis]|uniref:Uncharacterized protein n=1 Tax=Volvox carteri f. nagariensis TaxID=3068 RepID=D8TU48_VOLCA|nr:uncharacterized protein VOLCADRAFT_90347 [Volvox carteri f. nagariensis]EFJ48978.1 hypothetical protein VOLCADRAFT_90347 [Volvox carteri f. nagariensis]|eukprot:XP_002949875.1 hypothetical protein VOLCADRAFT_90347 [Volvox carteri f. nagariensis]
MYGTTLTTLKIVSTWQASAQSPIDSVTGYRSHPARSPLPPAASSCSPDLPSGQVDERIGAHLHNPYPAPPTIQYRHTGQYGLVRLERVNSCLDTESREQPLRHRFDLVLSVKGLADAAPPLLLPPPAPGTLCRIDVLLDTAADAGRLLFGKSVGEIAGIDDAAAAATADAKDDDDDDEPEFAASQGPLLLYLTSNTGAQRSSGRILSARDVVPSVPRPLLVAPPELLLEVAAAITEGDMAEMALAFRALGVETRRIMGIWAEEDIEAVVAEPPPDVGLEARVTAMVALELWPGVMLVPSF